MKNIFQRKKTPLLSSRLQRGVFALPAFLGSIKPSVGGGGSDPHWSNVVLLLHCDGANGSTSIVDSSASSKSVTANGGATLSTTAPLYGTASANLPRGGWLQVADSYDFFFNGDDFTVELAARFRSNPVSYGGDYGICLIGQTFVSVTSRRWMIQISGSDLSNCTVYAAIYSSGGSESKAQATGVNLALNTRHTFAMSRNGNFLHLLINGSIVAVADVPGTFIGTAPQPLMIGRFNDDTYSYFMDGDVDEVRITQGVGRYAENYTPATTPFPNQGPPADIDPYWDKVVALLKMDGASGSESFVDSGPLGLTVGANFAVRQSDVWSVSGRSAEFYSSGGFLGLSSDALAFGTKDFCVEATISIPSGMGPGCIFDARPTYGNGPYLTFVVSSTDILVYVDGATRISAAHSIPADTGTHVAVSRVSGVTRIFVAGSQVGSSWADTTNYQRGSDRPLIGALGFDSGLERFKGFMDEYRVTKGEGRYSANFTPPTGPFPTQGPPAVSPVAYEYTGSNQTLTVPAGVTSVNVKLWGAGGAGGSRAPIAYMDAAPGGGGGFTEGTLSVTPGETLTIIVGGGGTQSNSGGQNPRTFGDGGLGWGGGNQSGGAGGGRSAVRRGSAELATAGGGGGGGSTGNTGGAGGAGGGSVGMDGQGDTRGTGGTQTTGGSASPGSGNGAQLGAAFYGGNAGGIDGAGGGGGGGYYGGGGGGGNGQHGAGGGGGSGYTGGLTAATTSAGSGQNPGGLSDPDRNGAGVGGDQRNPGTHGRIVISW